MRHIVRGWSHFRGDFSESVEILPASKRTGEGWYEGTADAIYQNMDIIRTHKPGHVLILGGDHIYKMAYGSMLAYHQSKHADITVSCIEVSAQAARNTFYVITVNDQGKVTAFDEKPDKPAEIPGKPGRVLASMGNYVFSTQFLYQRLIADNDDPNSSHDFGKDIIPAAVGNCSVYAYRLGGDSPESCSYWRDVGNLDASWEANLELIRLEPERDLYDQVWPVYTHQFQLPSAKIVHDSTHRRGMAVDCIVSGGCLISGAALRRALLFSNVWVRSYSEIEDSVIFPDVRIGRKCSIRKAIIDSGCEIPAGIGVDREQDLARGYRVTDDGVTLVTPDHLGQSLHLIR